MISYILIIGAVIAGIVGYGHIQDDKLEDLPDGQVEIIIATPNSHGDDISIEDYQAYHDELRSNGAYQLLGYSLVCGMSLVLIGAVLIRLFRKEGVYIATTGATISLIGGVIANLRFQSAANEYLEGRLSIQYNSDDLCLWFNDGNVHSISRFTACKCWSQINS